MRVIRAIGKAGATAIVTAILLAALCSLGCYLSQRKIDQLLAETSGQANRAASPSNPQLHLPG